MARLRIAAITSPFSRNYPVSQELQQHQCSVCHLPANSTLERHTDADGSSIYKIYVIIGSNHLTRAVIASPSLWHSSHVRRYCPSRRHAHCPSSAEVQLLSPTSSTVSSDTVSRRQCSTRCSYEAISTMGGVFIHQAQVLESQGRI